jgi:C_GCAxxG_C_C family probable redox protein
MKSRSERAQEAHASGFNCAVSVLSAFAEEYGMSLQHARQVAGAFGGGMARTGCGPCGAASGGLMALGLMHGKTEPTDDAARDRCYAEGKSYLEAFESHCQGLSCRDLLGFDVSDPAQYQLATSSGAFARRCPVFMAAAVELAEARMPKP